MQDFSQHQLNLALKTLNENLSEQNKWQLQNGMLSKNFVFGDFMSAFSWMTKVAIFAEKIDHHPNWYNVYNRVEVNLITHDSNSITELDIQLASFMQDI